MNFSQKEKKDVDDIEAQLSGDNGTKELFIEQNSLEAAKQKELQEYLDAKNIEVIKLINSLTSLTPSFLFDTF